MEPSTKADMGTDFLKKIGPLGAAIVLIISAAGIFLAFTADLGVPERHSSRHDTAYYAQNAATMAELLSELREFVFPSLEGVTGAYVSPDGERIIIHVERARQARVRAAIVRDFDESLFEFSTEPPGSRGAN
jgi:hypothetical protein